MSGVTAARRLVCAALLACAFIVPLRAQAPAVRYAPDVQRIIDRGELVVALYANDTYPLFYTADDGSLQGFDVALSRHIAAVLGVKVRFDRSAPTTDGVLDVVLGGKADMGISLVSITPARALRCRFSAPYLVLQSVRVESRLASKGASPLVIAEREGTSYIDVARRLYPNAQLVTLPDWDATFQALLDGTAQYVLRDEIGVHNFITDKQRLALRLQFTPLSGMQDRIGIVLAPESAMLERFLNVFLAEGGYPKDAQYVFESYGTKR